MPKTKSQEIIFTMMMVLVMAYTMWVYNIALSSWWLTNSTFITGLEALPLTYIIALICAYFVWNKIAKKLAFRIVNPREDKAINIILAISVCSVCVMVPLMSFIEVIINHWFGSNFIPLVLTAICLNFIMALPLQIFVAGPLVRYTFRKIFIKNV